MDDSKPKDVTRRSLLKSLGMGVAAAAVIKAGGKAEAAVATATAAVSPEAGKRYAMVIDLNRCIGCHSCAVACKSEFDVPLSRWRSWVKTVEKGTYPNVKHHFLPRLCNHCSSAPCVDVCPTKASHIRPNGIVAVKEKLCIGCRNCMAVCPYNARFVHPMKKIVQKCDFCKHRVENGTEPSCVNTCPAGARIFGDLNDPKSEVSIILAKTAVQSLKPELGTKPNVYYVGADNKVMRAVGGGGRDE